MLELLLLLLVFITILCVLWYIVSYIDPPEHSNNTEAELKNHIRALDKALNNLKIKYRECTKNKYKYA